MADNLGFDLNTGTLADPLGPTTDFTFTGLFSSYSNGEYFQTNYPLFQYRLGLAEYEKLRYQEILELTPENIATHGDWLTATLRRTLPMAPNETVLFKTDEGQIFAVGDVTFVDNPGTLNDMVTFTYANVTEFFG